MLAMRKIPTELDETGAAELFEPFMHIGAIRVAGDQTSG